GLVGAVEEERQVGALLRGERHHADDALAVDLVAVGADEELRVELRRGADDHRGGPGVDAGPVPHGDFALDHGGGGSGEPGYVRGGRTRLADAPGHAAGDPTEVIAGGAGGERAERAL